MTVTVWIVAPNLDSAGERATAEGLTESTWKRITSPRSLPEDAAGQMLFTPDWRECWPDPDPETGDPTAEHGPGPLLTKAHALPDLNVEVVV